MEDAETSAVQRKALKLATAVAQQTTGSPTAAVPSRRWQVTVIVPERPVGSFDYHRTVRSSDSGLACAHRRCGVLGSFLRGAWFAEQRRRRIGQKALRLLLDFTSPRGAMRALTAPQSHPIMRNQGI
jgi:hypothetical protein